MTTMHEGATVPLFLYGTLRTGGPLAGLLPAGPFRYDATVVGSLFYSPHTRTYPVLVTEQTDYATEVHGEMVWLNLFDGDVAYVLTMELATGYSIEWVDTYYGGDRNCVIPALAFTWNPANGLGDHIPSHDWVEAQTQRMTWECSECGKAYDKRESRVECEWQHGEDDYMDAHYFNTQQIARNVP